MRFNSHFVRGLLMPLILTASVSCDKKFLFENPPPRDFKPLLGFDTKCLKNVLPVMSEFVDGTANPAQVTASWDCFGNAAQAFLENTKGVNTNQFTSREIANFFEKFFLEDVKIGDRLLLEIMHIKQLLVGGSEEILTTRELVKLIDFAKKMDHWSQQLLPYMQVFSQKWSLDPNKPLDAQVAYFERANQVIQDVARSLASLIEKNGAGYELRNLIVLADEMSQLYGSKWSFVDDLQRIMPLIEQLKRSLAGGAPERVAANEWRRFSLLSARGYVQYLRYLYFVDSASDSFGGTQLAYVARSVDDLFLYLGDMVREKPEGKFTKIELIDLLKTLTAVINKFGKDFKIEEPLVNQAMKIKKLFFGGSEDEWVPQDFERARSKVDAFRSLTEKIISYASVYSFSWKNDNLTEAEKQTHFALAETTLIEMVWRLGGLAESNYDLEDLGRLAAELQKTFPPEKPKTGILYNLQKINPVVIALKKIVLKDSSSVVSIGPDGNQWTQFLKLGAQGYARALYFSYFVKPNFLNFGTGLDAFRRLVIDSVSIFQDQIAQKGPILFSEFGLLAQALKDADLLPTLIRTSTVNGIVQIAFNKILLSPDDRLKKLPVTGMMSEHLKYIRFHLDEWFAAQMPLSQIYATIPSNSGLWQDTLSTSLKALPRSQPIDELVALLQTPVPMTQDNTNRFFISKNPIPYTLSSISMVNHLRTLVKVIINAYASEKVRVLQKPGINEVEAQQLFTDLRPLLVELEIVDAKNTTFARNRFLEGDLLTPRSNGDGIVSLFEGTNLALSLLSGTIFASRLEELFAAECVSLLGFMKMQTQLPVTCAIETYRRNLAELYSLPQMANYMQNLSGPAFNEYLMSLLVGTGWSPAKQISYDDVGLVPHLLQYIEALMQRLDINNDDILDQDEALASFPAFKSLIAKASCSRSYDRNYNIFAYILRYGRPPESTKELIKFALIWERRFKADWTFNVDRKKIADILAYIVKSSGDSKACAPEPPPPGPRLIGM